MDGATKLPAGISNKPQQCVKTHMAETDNNLEILLLLATRGKRRFCTST